MVTRVSRGFDTHRTSLDLVAPEYSTLASAIYGDDVVVLPVHVAVHHVHRVAVALLTVVVVAAVVAPVVVAAAVCARVRVCLKPVCKCEDRGQTIRFGKTVPVSPDPRDSSKRGVCAKGTIALGDWLSGTRPRNGPETRIMRCAE